MTYLKSRCGSLNDGITCFSSLIRALISFYYDPSYCGGTTLTLGCTLTLPPPVERGAYMLLVPAWPVNVLFHPPLMVTIPILLHVGASL